MAKAVAVVSALCFLAFASFAHAQKSFTVEGKVYCDPCRVEFITSLSRGIAGVPVKLECRNRDTGVVTIAVTSDTNKEGFYRLIVAGDHEEEICEIFSLNSPDKECNVAFDGTGRARVLLTENSGVQGTDRYANPLGFKTSQPNAECKAILEEMGFVPDN